MCVVYLSWAYKLEICTTFYEVFLKQSIYIEALVVVAPISVRIYRQWRNTEEGDTGNRKRSQGSLNSVGFLYIFR
jgi:hypothetical protein